MPATLHFRQLSAPRQRLVRLFQSINFGRIEDLEVRSGEPVFSPAPRVLSSVDLASDGDSRPEYDLGDFALPKETVRLMDRLPTVSAVGALVDIIVSILNAAGVFGKASQPTQLAAAPVPAAQ